MSDSEIPAAIRDMPEQQQRWYTLGWQAAIARYALPTIQPVPVSERLPGPEDCDEEGRCWWGYTGSGNCAYTQWQLKRQADRWGSELAWLPHWALPVPSSPANE